MNPTVRNLIYATLLSATTLIGLYVIKPSNQSDVEISKIAAQNKIDQLRLASEQNKVRRITDAHASCLVAVQQSVGPAWIEHNAAAFAQLVSETCNQAPITAQVKD